MMADETIKTYVTRDRKRNAVIAFCIVLTVFILISVIELLPGNIPDLSQADDTGVGRAFIFPFVFTDSNNNLFVISEKKEVLPVDDTVSNVIHDITTGKVFYLRENILYEYDIQKNIRKKLIDDCLFYRLLDDRSVLFTVSSDMTAGIYKFKRSATVDIGRGVSNLISDNLYCLGEKGFLFASNLDSANGQLDLVYSDLNGKTKKIASGIDAGKNFYLSNDNKYICYKQDNVLKITDKNGKIIASEHGAQIIKSSENTVITEPNTEKILLNQSVPFKYFLSDLKTDSGVTSATLKYFNGKELKTIANRISDIIFYSEKDDMIFYTVQDDNSSTIYISSSGKKGQKQITCDKNATFMYHEPLGLMYFRNEDATLNRYRVFDVTLKISKISDNTGFLYTYYNKKIMGYQKNDDTKDTYLLFKKGDIDKIDISEEIRLYGLDDDVYIMCRRYSENKLSLDLVRDDKATRIASNVMNGVFFDYNMEYIIYSTENKLYLWNKDQSSLLGEYGEITPSALAV